MIVKNIIIHNYYLILGRILYLWHKRKLFNCWSEKNFTGLFQIKLMSAKPQTNATFYLHILILVFI